MSVEMFGLYIVTLFSVLVCTESVMCYQCADSKKFGDCQSDMKKFKMSVLNYLENNRSIGSDHERGYLKNCTPQWGDYCVIEHYTERGETLSFIRGCSNGNVDISVKGFLKFSADNQTACQYYPDSQDHVLACVTWCNSDLCNGPFEYRQLLLKTSDSSHSVLHSVFIFMYVLQIIFIIFVH